MSTPSTTGIKPKLTHLELRSGIYLDFENPQPEDISFDDLALSLSNTCRWGGHCQPFYSVAEHACLVHDIVRAWEGTWNQRFAALHHDDHEAYVGDIPTPLKRIFGDAYETVTLKLDVAIAERFDIYAVDFHDPLVKKADRLALFLEAERFKPSKGLHWAGRPQVVALPEGVLCQFGRNAIWARAAYERRHHALEVSR